MDVMAFAKDTWTRHRESKQRIQLEQVEWKRVEMVEKMKDVR
jgi:hypothetical protein